jgi:hypothetical protein
MLLLGDIVAPHGNKAVIEQNMRTGHQRAHSKDHSKKREAPRLEHSARGITTRAGIEGEPHCFAVTLRQEETDCSRH